MLNIAICDDEETLIGELKENLIKYAAETNKEFCFFIYHDGSVYFKEGIWFCQSLFCVCAPWARSNGCKSRTCPDSGKCIAEQQGVYREVESEGSCKQISGSTNRNHI